MGLSILFSAPIFKKKSESRIRLLLAATGVVNVGFLVGTALGVFAAGIIASFLWSVLFPIAAVLIAKAFKQSQLQKAN